MEKGLMKGNEALAEAMVRAGCRFFSGYPITPQNEILEYLSWRMKEAGGAFVQSESELAAINMVLGAASAGARAMTSSSGPGFSLLQEGISYLIAGDIPAVIVDVARFGSGIGEISQGQCDYKLVTRGNGHGDSHLLVLAPASVQESVDLMMEAFPLAEKYRHPVIILSDAAIGQMVEPVSFPPMEEVDIDRDDWTVKGCKGDDESKKITNVFYYMDDYNSFLRDKYQRMTENEQRYEAIHVEDAQLVLVAYGISARVCKEAVRKARSQGVPLGLIRPISIYPYPKKAFAELSGECKALMTVEMSITGQMAEDVKLAVDCRYPVYTYGTGIKVPKSADVVKYAVEILEGKMDKEVF
ncbi:3-methyl-2-oxobutanoate dehydrogenase subunit VorB [Lactonifactor longoviformis]|uniref:2-oxoglutarate ferredoxin oxidoreductase subunit alpha n=1 Tax=Lactonifactor longoviformis DSM 17459 TaxID=1122155 RepID=A0A1M4T2S7_9CLOT|nr:3-methyl-2-oxobutanoate dehydrogenase subunit VorB [Lactonifactor longoviformis]POP33662.1 3-methyl-2-oxobutanoate dehydrogenase subunit VorB [Lactonifactor longoviformis]SHE38694.1 2-oxoglutarate ferredoxin oxidoreductase subunit alpha [Lactonifactor longoviformis DSM 17459]